MKHITIRMPVTDEFLGDVIITAVEGGINYWAERLRYTADDDVAAGRDISPSESITALIRDREDAASRNFELNPVTILAGMRTLLLLKHPGSPVYGCVMDALAEKDAGHIDADAADCIVQYSMFGALVYG